jgi:hypothetical protein
MATDAGQTAEHTTIPKPRRRWLQFDRRRVTYANFKASGSAGATRCPGCCSPCRVVQCGERPGGSGCRLRVMRLWRGHLPIAPTSPRHNPATIIVRLQRQRSDIVHFGSCGRPLLAARQDLLAHGNGVRKRPTKNSSRNQDPYSYCLAGW